jgi:hypothetical protein
MASLLDMAQARLQGLLDIPTRAGRALVNPTLFSGLLGAPTLPQQQGMAEAAYGLPARQNMSVLDPKQAAYLQGYQQGEPLSYLGMATPFAAPAIAAGAKAVAPKAGMALENYMASQGLLQPLTAYHGTPHTIRGQFDISKVGTGEGAQAYGHGMYFAENPAVATQYKNILSKPEFTKTGEGVELRGQLPRMLDETYSELVAKNGIQQTNYGDVTDLVGQRLDRQMKDALKANDMDWYNKTADMKLDLARFKENPPPNVGNLYKVDIPDADIPNMLNWDEPLSKQPKSVQDALAKFDPDLYSKKGSDYSPEERGESIYMRIANSPQAKNFLEASAVLESLGIKGIRYLDAGSRPTNVIDKRLEDLYQKHSGDIEKAADDFMRTIHDSPKKKAEIRAGIVQDLQNRPTSNFVVFDPADVKILEKNSQKVEGLLD